MKFIIDRMPETSEGCLFMTRQFEEREENGEITVHESYKCSLKIQRNGMENCGCEVETCGFLEEIG